MKIYKEETNYQKAMKQVVEPYLKEHMQDGYIRSSDGTRLHYEIFELPQARGNVVISHGFSEYAGKYNEIIYMFLQQNYSVYFIEHRGHGHSKRSTRDLEKVHVLNFQDYVSDLHSFVTQFVLPQRKHTFLFAHSMGGAIGASYLETYPEDFEAAILSSPMIQMRTGDFMTLAAKLIADIYCLLGKGHQYAAGQKGFDSEPDLEGSCCSSLARYRYFMKQRLSDPLDQTTGGSYAWVNAALNATRKLQRRQNIAKIQLPVLLCVAGRDTMVKNKNMIRFGKLLPDCTFVVFPDSKHEIFNGMPADRKRYYKAVFWFLAKYSC